MASAADQEHDPDTNGRASGDDPGATAAVDLTSCFKKGVVLERQKFDGVLDATTAPASINLLDVMGQGLDIDFGLDIEPLSAAPAAASVAEKVAISSPGDDIKAKDLETAATADESNVVKPVKPSDDTAAVEEWAVMVDINKPVSDFHERIPCMARQWDFELDTFQKQAILHVESRDHVLVAAHTSAGKTVVAEYAIALCQRHLTKAIYTSPIKALSNQKFRDFKDIFSSVGLITGDVQIKPDADCVVMTTEILRSMLYNGSEVIRDLEWVIFDEVHYINDAERGVVWEEVLIMLPAHVRIVMLSATVPNTKEFAEWVGRTKHKKVYVISTTKRPVPLEHYLYTGNSAKTSNELFLVLDSRMEFFTAGYNKALEAKKLRASKQSQSFGPRGGRQQVNPQQDKNIWLSVIEMLRKREELPAIAFVFSRNRIDELTNSLTSVDLVDGHDSRHQIHTFFERCTDRLQGTDKQLPQVLQMRRLLEKGIGIHHSGILPILKEIVEMLFQRGLVKILFATETFAMGVNMPARTVVFDCMRKHDGNAPRDLLAGEYIQMAGRAGRRGKDEAGTVIMLCKGDVPEISDLHRMMLGKTVQLQSQFRLTYSMILNLLRVEQLRVEDMIKRSFGEHSAQKEAPVHSYRLRQLEPVISNLPTVADFSGDLQEYYDSCDEYFRLRDRINDQIYVKYIGTKVLSPGRVVLIDTQQHCNVPAVILQTKDKAIRVLVLCEKKTGDNNFGPNVVLLVANDKESRPRPVLGGPLFLPEGQCSQAVVSITVDDLAAVSAKVLKINADRILDDVKKREQPRFRNDPPGQSCQLATQELLRLSESSVAGLPMFDPVSDLHMQDIDLVQDVRRFQFLRQTLPTFRCVDDPNFEDNFRQLRENTKLRQEYQRLKVLLSDESLMLLPEYQQRIKVLQRLDYVNQEGVVKLKGQTACQLSVGEGHELLITELVFDNAFQELEPPELASILSCVVFQTGRCSEPNISPVLLKSRERVCKMAETVAVLEKECGVPVCVEDYVESLHFGLMEVVYEWARGMPFSEITNLTEIQEGLIVRCIQRLDEALSDLMKAARTIGDSVLENKAEKASAAIKRDIVFAASLYTQ